MHTNFNFSFLYPVTQVLPDGKRHGGVQYMHIIDLVINGTGTKRHMTPGDTGDPVSFEIDEILAENENIFYMLEKANALEAIRAACLHHVKQATFGQWTDYRMSYLPLKKAI